MNCFNVIVSGVAELAKRADQSQNISFQSYIFEKWEDFQKLQKYFARPYCFFVIADTIQGSYIVTSMLVERDLPKGVEDLIEIFALETNKPTNKNKTQTKKDKRTLIRRNENTEITSQSKLDPFSCIVVHEPEKRPTSLL